MSSPFDDPDFRAQLAEMGIVHAPGTAERTLGEIKPLLAADGIDLDSLESDDLDSLNAALERAMQRHNFELFTPVGAHRGRSLMVLRRFTESLAADDHDAATITLARVEPEPSDSTPAISHVIGVSLGLLDTWHTDDELRTSLAAVRVPRWGGKATRTVARDVLALAAKGRAFDSIRSLQGRYSGLDIFEGAALAVAASISARAAHEGVGIAALADAMLVGAVPDNDAPSSTTPSTRRRPQPSSGSAFRRSDTRATPAAGGADIVAHEFAVWAERQPDVPTADVAEAIESLDLLRTLARGVRLDPDDPDDVGELIDVIFDLDASTPEATAPMLLDALDAYLHFRLETAHDPHVWVEAHEMVEEAMLELAPESEALAEAFDATARIDPDERRTAFGRLRIVTGVSELLAWIGSRRDATATGGVRRADIERVAELIGVAAVGVARRRPAEPSDRATLVDVPADPATHAPGTVYVLSMNEAPALAAWWRALAVTDLIRTQPGRVEPGSAAGEWVAEERPPLELAEMVVGVFVAELITHGLERASSSDAESLAAIGVLLRALAPDTADDAEITPSAAAAAIEPTLRHLTALGLLETDDRGERVVPAVIRSAIAKGLVLTMAQLRQL